MPTAGKRQGRAFSAQQAAAIRDRYHRRGESQSQLAKLYGVTRETIRDVILRQRAYSADEAVENSSDNFLDQAMAAEAQTRLAKEQLAVAAAVASEDRLEDPLKRRAVVDYLIAVAGGRQLVPQDLELMLIASRDNGEILDSTGNRYRCHRLE